MSLQCRICNNTEDNEKYVVREMMFGTRDQFEYFTCSKCECLQIIEIPENLETYYPKDYYSFSRPLPSKIGATKRFMKRQRTSYCLHNKNFIGMILKKIYTEPELPAWLYYAVPKMNDRILDFGCGSGQLLFQLYNEGFSDLTGFDPYLDKNTFHKNGIRIFNEKIGANDERFDFIMLNHSFEHVPDPMETLRAVSGKINQGGIVMVRIPVVSSHAWRKYKEHWVQLDAPRHLFLHSPKSMKIIADGANLLIEDIQYDSNELQFWGSEQYVADIPLHDERSYRNGIEGSLFTEDDIQRFKKMAEELNAVQEGDQACFFLKKPS